MKTLLTVALAFALAAPVSAQVVDVVSPPWRLYLEENDSTISYHNEIENAIEAAGEFYAAHPGTGELLMMPSAPWRVAFNFPGAVTDTVIVTITDTLIVTDTIYLAPPDTTPPPPPDTTTPPPPPSGVAWTVGWGAPAGTNGAELSDPNGGRFERGGTGLGQGVSRVADLASPGPWGGTKALENRYGVTAPATQPQVGTYWHLPAPTRELYLETWVRFAPEWEIGPGNPNYPGGNVDHKLIFAMVGPDGGGWTHRWECKVGVWWKTMPCSARSHDVFYRYMAIPPIAVHPGPVGDRLDANLAAWDGRWHRLRMGMKMGNPGVFRVWWDGNLVIDAGALDTESGPNDQFRAILFGGNRNQGTNHPMSFYFGEARVYLTDPGW